MCYRAEGSDGLADLCAPDVCSAHICGEGGEFESFTLDCPLYKKRIVVEEAKAVSLSDDEYAPVAYLQMPTLRCETPPQESTPQACACAMHTAVPGCRPTLQRSSRWGILDF